MSKTTLLTVNQICERHPALTVGGLRFLLFNRAQNGLYSAVVRIGKRLLIDEAAFLDWVEKHREGPTS